MTPQTIPILLGAEAPRVLTVPMVAAILADRGRPVARNTLFRWLRLQQEAGALRPLTRGLYLNQLATPRPKAAEAAAYVRSGAIVSLQTVLGDAGVLNNYSDVVTCVLPFTDGMSASSRPVRAERAEYRFHVMPVRLLDDRAGALDDRMDLDVAYARATPEKALLDWIYLGASPRTRIAGPPMDIDMIQLDARRLRRLARQMGLEQPLGDFLHRQRRHADDPSVRANASVDP